MVLANGTYQYYLRDHLGNTHAMFSKNAGRGEPTTLAQATDYYPFGKSFENSNVDKNRYLYNGKELQDQVIGSTFFGWYDYGARFYDPEIGRWHVMDPLSEKGRRWSPYVYTFNNPLRFTDPDGQWPWGAPGVGFFFFQGNVGAGLGYSLYAVQQSGIAHDDYGTTHFQMTGTAHITNQNLEEGSKNPNYVLGADVGVSAGYTHDWSSSSFVESVQKSNQTSVPGPTIKGSLGVGIAANENSLSLSVGLQAGASVNTMGMKVDVSISLTNSEASKVSNKTDVATENWSVGNIKQVVNKAGDVTGYSGVVMTKNTKGEAINTGVKVNSGVVTSGGKTTSNHMWISPAYQRKIDENKK